MPGEDTEQYRLFIGRLQREEHRPAALNDIKNLLAFKPAGEAVSTIRDVGITQIVQCLNVPNTYVLFSVLNFFHLFIIIVFEPIN